MNTRVIKKETIVYILLLLIVVLTPLLSGTLFCSKDGKTLKDIYIPLGGWSDEITYYKQVEAVLECGFPKGYFGYNQSQAKIGGFSTWGPLPIVPYVIWGLLFGWNYLSPIYANIFFVSLGFAILLFVLKPKRVNLLMFLLAFLVSPMLVRHMLSAVVEPMYYLLLIVSLAASLKYYKSEEQKTASYVTALVTISLLTIMRGYFAVLFLIPFWKNIKEKKWIYWPIISAISSSLLFLVTRFFFCASYYGGGIGSDLFDKIKGFFSNTLQFLRLIWYSVRYKDAIVPWSYTYWALTMLCIVVALILSKAKEKKFNELYIITLIMNLCVYVAVLILYSLSSGGRHLLIFALMNTIILMSEADFKFLIPIVGCGIAALFLMNNIEGIPYADKEYVFWMNELTEEFNECIKLTDDLSMENVITMPTSDDNGATYYGYLFAAPAGMGVSIDERSLYDDPSKITAGYVIVNPSGSARFSLEKAGYKNIFENDKIILYHKS